MQKPKRNVRWLIRWSENRLTDKTNFITFLINVVGIKCYSETTKHTQCSWTLSVVHYFQTLFKTFIYFSSYSTLQLPSVLWRCWLVGRKGIRTVKNWVVGYWRGYLTERDADLHMAQWMPLPLTVSFFSKIQISFSFLVPAHLGSPGQRAIKWVCVCVTPHHTTNKIRTSRICDTDLRPDALPATKKQHQYIKGKLDVYYGQ